MKFILTILILTLAPFCYADYSKTQLQIIHSTTLQNFNYVSDLVNYGVNDKWITNCDRGDCEDYALCLYNKLGGDLAIVKTVTNEYHTVLIVDNYVLDNTKAKVYHVNEMSHKLIATIPKNSKFYLF